MLRKDNEFFEIKGVMNDGYSNCENMQALSNNLVAYHTIAQPQPYMQQSYGYRERPYTLTINPAGKLKASALNSMSFEGMEMWRKITKEPVISITAVSLDRLVYSTTTAVSIYSYGNSFRETVLYNKPLSKLAYVPSNNLIFGIPYDPNAQKDYIKYSNTIVGIELNSNYNFSFNVPLENQQKFISNLYSCSHNNTSFLLIQNGNTLWRKDLKSTMDVEDKCKEPVKLKGNYNHPTSSIQDNYYVSYDKGTQLISIWDIEESKLISNIEHTDEIYSLALWPGKHSFVTLDLNHIKVWDIQSKKVILQYSNWSNELQKREHFFNYTLARNKPDICFSHASYSIFIGLAYAGKEIELDVLDYFRQYDHWYNNPPTSFLLNSAYQSLQKIAIHQKYAVAKSTPLPYPLIKIITDYLRDDTININDELNLLNKPSLKNLANEFKVFQRETLSDNQKHAMMSDILGSIFGGDYNRSCWTFSLADPEVSLEMIYNILHLQEKFYIYWYLDTFQRYIDPDLLAAKINDMKNLIALMCIFDKGENQYGFLKLLGKVHLANFFDADENTRFCELKGLLESCNAPEPQNFLMDVYTTRWASFFADPAHGKSRLLETTKILNKTKKGNKLLDTLLDKLNALSNQPVNYYDITKKLDEIFFRIQLDDLIHCIDDYKNDETITLRASQIVYLIEKYDSHYYHKWFMERIYPKWLPAICNTTEGLCNLLNNLEKSERQCEVLKLFEGHHVSDCLKKVSNDVDQRLNALLALLKSCKDAEAQRLLLSPLYYSCVDVYNNVVSALLCHINSTDRLEKIFKTLHKRENFTFNYFLCKPIREGFLPQFKYETIEEMDNLPSSVLSYYKFPKSLRDKLSRFNRDNNLEDKESPAVRR